VKALLLAAGYATRLRPLTNEIPKPLLEVAGRPMVDWTLDQLSACEEIESVELVTNALYAPGFARWGESRGVVVHDDGTSSNETRLGAIGDVRFALEQGHLAGEPLLVIAADNLFEFSLSDYIEFWRGKGETSAIAVHRLADPGLASLYGVVELDADERVVGLEEKPERPKSDLVSTATYLFSAEHLGLIDTYLAGGNAPDPPGKFLIWLCGRAAVYGFRFEESWLDIGELSQLLEADNLYRSRSGMPERAVYESERVTLRDR
jgi:glucose-1-phosphate thymidylyltransferase